MRRSLWNDISGTPVISHVYTLYLEVTKWDPTRTASLIRPPRLGSSVEITGQCGAVFPRYHHFRDVHCHIATVIGGRLHNLLQSSTEVLNLVPVPCCVPGYRYSSTMLHTCYATCHAKLYLHAMLMAMLHAMLHVYIAVTHIPSNCETCCIEYLVCMRYFYCTSLTANQRSRGPCAFHSKIY